MDKGSTFNLTQVDTQQQFARKLTTVSTPIDKTSNDKTPVPKIYSKVQFDLSKVEKQNFIKLPKLRSLTTDTTKNMFRSVPGSPKLHRNLTMGRRKSPEVEKKATKMQEDSNQQFFQDAQSQAEYELKKLYTGSPKLLTQTIRKIESSRNIIDYVSLLHDQVINVKSKHSKLKFDRESLEQQNQKLEEIITNLGQIKTESNFWQKSLDEIENRYSQMQTAVENETFQQSRLEYLISQKRSQITVMKKPIQDLRQEITKKHFEIQEETQKLTLKKRQLTEKLIQKQKKMGNLAQNRILNQQKQDNNQQVLKEYFMFQGICEKERELDLDQKKKDFEDQMNKEKTIRVEREQQDQVLEEEMKKNQEYIKRQDKMFQKISDVTNINNIVEMFSHLTYLQDTSENLKQTKEEHNQRIKEYTCLIEQLQQELQQLKYSSKDQIKENVSKRQIEQQLYVDLKKLETKEVKLNDLEDLLSTSLTSVSRLVTQLSDKNILQDINPQNCSQKLAEIGLKLERMVWSLSKKFSINVENINDGNIITPPTYMGVSLKQSQYLEKLQEQCQGLKLESITESDRQFYENQKGNIKKENNRVIEAIAKAARVNNSSPKN